MGKKVLITLSVIQIQDDEENKTELLTHADHSRKNGSDIISYKDTSATGFEGSTTTITADGSTSVSIVREGTANSAMYLEAGKKHFCEYGTPYGSMQLGVYTKEIKNSLATDGTLSLKYTLDLNSAYLSDNEIVLTIK